MDAIPWYRSPVLISTIIALLSQGVVVARQFGVTVPFTDDQISLAVGGVFQLIAIAATLWALIARFRSKVQPIAASAAHAATLNDPTKSGGFARTGMLTMLLGAALMSSMVGCVGTRAAFKAADGPDELAIVVMKNYSAAVSEAVTIAANPQTPGGVVRALQLADQKAKSIVVALAPLRRAYLDGKSAKSRADLQAAVERAIVVVAELTAAVKSAGGRP